MISHSPSRSPKAVLQKQISLLKKGEVDPSLHYHSRLQSEAWKRVFKKHSPVSKDPSFGRIYQTLFSRVSISTSKKNHLIGLGCGTGVKERWLAKSMKQHGFQIQCFTAVDVSEDLCRMSMKRIHSFSVEEPKARVMDLDAVKELRIQLDQKCLREQRIYTFFGLVPNLAPESVVFILKEIMRPGDQLLLSANLAPVLKEDESDGERALKKILPQYRNKETREWLSLLFQEQGIKWGCLSPLRFGVEKGKGYRSVVVRTEIKNDFEWVLGSTILKMKKGESLKVFQSRRWTPKAFEGWMRENGFKIRASEITPNREEGVWWVER